MTVLLDTNVVSELMRKAPEPAVAVWAAGHRLENLFFSAVGEAELRYGAAILPTGQRRDTLVSDIERMLGEAFEGRVLPFDSGAARAYADIAARRRSAGRPVAPDLLAYAELRYRGTGQALEAAELFLPRVLDDAMVPTVTRSPRMHGRPPTTSGSCVIRCSRIMAPV